MSSQYELLDEVRNMPAPNPSWVVIMQPMVDRLELSAKMGLDFIHHPAGATALAAVIRKMATIIDNDIDHRNRDN